jgi:hypothetical protein
MADGGMSQGAGVCWVLGRHALPATLAALGSCWHGPCLPRPDARPCTPSARAPPQKVHSLDLVATEPGVIACNMADTPLAPGSVDAAVFCLALMGTDYGGFLAEAHRVLKARGWLWVAEVGGTLGAGCDV